jgi:hypothetical protein
VRVLDYSCADEIVAKLLLRFSGDERPADAFFVVRGMQEHHEEAIEAVLERHSLLLVARDDEGVVKLLGEPDPAHRAVWEALTRRGRASRARRGRRHRPLARGGRGHAFGADGHRGWRPLHPDGTVSPLSVLLDEDEG